MTKANLKEALRGLVHQFGFEQVGRSLREIRYSELDENRSKRADVLSRTVSAKKAEKKKPKVSAPEYVEKMKLGADKEPIVLELATRFEGKDFLPTFGDIDNFCRFYGIDTPVSRSRASAIPRVFKYIATMDTEEARKILDYGMFSGPSRLGPISDAIRNYGSARRATRV